MCGWGIGVGGEQRGQIVSLWLDGACDSGLACMRPQPGGGERTGCRALPCSFAHVRSGTQCTAPCRSRVPRPACEVKTPRHAHPCGSLPLKSSLLPCSDMEAVEALMAADPTVDHVDWSPFAIGAIGAHPARPLRSPWPRSALAAGHAVGKGHVAHALHCRCPHSRRALPALSAAQGCRGQARKAMPGPLPCSQHSGSSHPRPRRLACSLLLLPTAAPPPHPLPQCPARFTRCRTTGWCVTWRPTPTWPPSWRRTRCV